MTFFVSCYIFGLKYTLSDLSMVIAAFFFWLLFAQSTIFHPFTLNLFVFGGEVSLLKAAYSQVLFFNLSSHLVPFDGEFTYLHLE